MSESAPAGAPRREGGARGTAGEPLLRVTDLAAGYVRGVDVLSEVSLSVASGELTALVGRNGSGKTTLLRALLGLLPVRRGGVVFADGARPRTGYVPQADRSELRFPVSALDVVLMGLTPGLGAWRRPGAAGRAAARASLERFGVADLAPKRFADLSGGQRQRVLLARALVHDPQLLVLDEPVRGLDLPSAANLVRLLVREARESGLAVLVATHSLDLVANHADAVALFRAGRCRFGPAREIFTDAVLSEHHDAPVIVREVEGQRVVLPGPAS